MKGLRPGRILGAVVAAAVAAWLALAAPFSMLGTANLALIYSLVAISLVVLIGWVGQISLAQGAFVGLGAFSTGVVIRWYSLDFPITIVAGAVAGAVAAALLAVVALRVRGLFLAVATLIFAWAAQAYLFNQPWLAGVGGSSIAGTEPLGEEGTVPFLDLSDRRTFYVLLLATLLGVVVAAANLRDSKTGRAWFAVKGSEIAAASLGIDVVRTKLVAFALSGFIAGMAGAMTMTHEGVATAGDFTVQESLFYLAVAVVGGLTSLGGAVASGVLFASLEEMSFRFEFLSGMVLTISAALLAAVLLFFPAGLAGVPERMTAFVRAAWRLPITVATRRWLAEQWRRPRAREAVVVADDADETTEATDEAADGPEPTEPAPVVLGGLGGRLYALGSWARRSFTAWRTNRVGAPDALVASFVAAEETEPVDESEDAVPAGLAYRPGQATKVELPPRDQREVVLAARNITVRFGGLTAVNDFHLEVRQGEIVGLIGPNGAGKTTLFNAISGLNEPTMGSVEVYGRDVSSLAVHERARLGVGRTFQAVQLFPELTVFDNLMVATHQRNPTGFFTHLVTTRSAVGWEVVSRDRVRQVIALVGLQEVADRRVADLPFGMLRLVELARALVTGAPFMMLDEPASGLDNAETDAFMDLLLWVRQTLGITMLLIEHDMRVVMSLADHVYVIDRGTQIASGTPNVVQRDDAVIAAYLGAAPGDEDEGEGAGAGEARADRPLVAGGHARSRTGTRR